MALPAGVIFDLNPASLTTAVGDEMVDDLVSGLAVYPSDGFDNYCTNPGPHTASGWSVFGGTRTNYATRPLPYDDSTLTGWSATPGTGGAGTFAVRAADGTRPYRGFRYTWSTASSTVTGLGGIVCEAVDVTAGATEGSVAPSTIPAANTTIRGYMEPDIFGASHRNRSFPETIAR